MRPDDPALHDPLQNDEEHAAALAEVCDLVNLNPAPGTAEAERLEALAIVVEAYEVQHWPL